MTPYLTVHCRWCDWYARNLLQSVHHSISQTKVFFDFEASFPVNLFISISTLATVLQVVAAAAAAAAAAVVVVVVVVIGVSSRLSGCKVV